MKSNERRRAGEFVVVEDVEVKFVVGDSCVLWAWARHFLVAVDHIDERREELFTSEFGAVINSNDENRWHRGGAIRVTNCADVKVTYEEDTDTDKEHALRSNGSRLGSAECCIGM